MKNYISLVCLFGSIGLVAGDKQTTSPLRSGPSPLRPSGTMAPCSPLSFGSPRIPISPERTGLFLNGVELKLSPDAQPRSPKR